MSSVRVRYSKGLRGRLLAQLAEHICNPSLILISGPSSLKCVVFRCVGFGYFRLWLTGFLHGELSGSNPHVVRRPI